VSLIRGLSAGQSHENGSDSPSNINTVVMPATDIDDQIIPARFLTTTTRGLGANLFHDWRFASDEI
jgi:hypothetical protein